MTPDWDRHCAEFAAAHVKAETGRDIWAEVGGVPRSPREAAGLYRKLRARTLRGIMGKLFGKPVKPAHAMRGDVALVMSGSVAALGIVRGDLIECMDRTLPINRAVACWKVSRFRPTKGT